MKAIILAAGQGTRLRPLTDDKPKCMVEYKGKQLIDYQIEALRGAGIKDIVIVRGYKGEKLIKENAIYCTNENYNTTNMVESLFCAAIEFDDDIIVTYSDIIYSATTVSKLMDSKAEISVIIDRNWESLWKLRMEDPWSDAETLKLDKDMNLVEIGKKIRSKDDVQGQYVGLIKFSKTILPQITDYYNSLDRSAIYDGKDFKNMFMTSFLQLINDHLVKIKAVEIFGGWLEVDCLDDLKVDVEIK